MPSPDFVNMTALQFGGTSATYAVPMPPARVAGNLICCFFSTAQAAAGITKPNAAWTVEYGAPAGGVGGMAWSRVDSGAGSPSVGSGAQSFTFGAATGLGVLKAVQFTGVYPTGNPFRGMWDIRSDAGSATTPITSLTTDSANTLLFWVNVGGTNYAMTTFPSGFTAVSNTDYDFSHYAHKDQLAAGPTGDVQGTRAGPPADSSQLIAIASEAGGAPPPTADLDTMFGGAQKDTAWAAMAAGAKKTPSGLYVMQGGVKKSHA